MNKRDESGNTPLIYACLKSARDLVKLLLDNGESVMVSRQYAPAIKRKLGL